MERPRPHAPIKPLGFIAILVAGAGLMISLTIGLHYFVTSRVAFSVDFYVYWRAGRALASSQQSPYSLEAAQAAQLAISGQLAQPGEQQWWFPYPLYSLLPVWPLVGLDYPWAQAAWLAFNLVLWLMALRAALPQVHAGLIMLTLAAYPIIIGLLLGNYSMLIASISCLIYILINDPRRFGHFLVGVMLAWITTKPLLTWLIVPMFLLMALRKQYYWVWGGAIVGSLCLMLITWLWLPGWPGLWLEQMRAYDNRLSLTSIADIISALLLPTALVDWGSIAIRLASVIASAVWLWRWWRGEYTDVIALTVCVWLTQMLHIYVSPSEQILLIFALLLWLETATARPTPVWMGIGLAALIVPWGVFFYLFNGREPREVNIVVPLVFALWLAVVTRRPITVTA